MTSPQSDTPILVCPVTGQKSHTNPHDTPAPKDDTSAPTFTCPVTGQTSNVNPHEESSTSEATLACPVTGQSAAPSSIPAICPFANKQTTKFYNERFICRYCDLYAYEPVLSGDSYVCTQCYVKNEAKESENAPVSEQYDTFLMISALEDQWAHAMQKMDPRYQELGPQHLVALCTKENLAERAYNVDEASEDDKNLAHADFILTLDVFFDKSSFYLQNALSFSKVGNREACIWYLERAFSFVDMVLTQLKEYKDTQEASKLAARFYTLGGVLQGLLGDVVRDTAQKITHLEKSVELLNQSSERDDDVLQALSSSYCKHIAVASNSTTKLSLYKRLIAVQRETLRSARGAAAQEAEGKMQLAQTLMHQGAELIRATKKTEAHKAYTDSLQLLNEVENNMFFLPNAQQVKQRIEDTRNLISEKLNSTRQ